MSRTDQQLDRQLARVRRRLRRVRSRRGDDAGAVERLERRMARLEQLRAMPASERPPRLRISADLVRAALDVALVALSATPAGPLLQGAKLGVGALQKVSGSIRQQDLDGTVDGLLGALRAELAQRGVTLDEDDASLASVAAILEEQLDRDA